MSDNNAGKPQKISREVAAGLRERCGVTLECRDDGIYEPGNTHKRGYYILHCNHLNEKEITDLGRWVELTAFTPAGAYSGDVQSAPAIRRGKSLVYPKQDFGDFAYFGLELLPIHPAKAKSNAVYPEEAELARVWREMKTEHFNGGEAAYRDMPRVDAGHDVPQGPKWAHRAHAREEKGVFDKGEARRP